MAKRMFDEPDTQTDAEDAAPKRERNFGEWILDNSANIFTVLFFALLLVSLFPPYVGVVGKIGNLFVIFGTAFVASGSILKSSLLNHANDIINYEKISPTRYVRRGEMLRELSKMAAEIKETKSCEIFRGIVDNELLAEENRSPLVGPMISQKNIAETMVTLSKKTYLGSGLIILGTIAMFLEQCDKSFSWAAGILHLP